MKMGFTGTQNGMTTAQQKVVSYLLGERCPDEVRHGDCIGADADFHEFAQLLGLRTVIHPPLNQSKRAFCEGAVALMPRRDYLQRNHDIVDAVDEMIATPAGFEEQLRSGTWATIRYAKKRKVPVHVVWPDGKVDVQ